MYIVAGPPGSGKSDAFKLKDFRVDFFNADDRAAALNGGSYHNIPLEIRAQVNQEFERFIEGHIDERKSFAFETTLRTPITFAQAQRAHDNGFVVNMVYVALDDVQINLRRIKARARLGFHSAPVEVLRGIHAHSLENLKQAVLECGVSIDQLAIFDNTAFGESPRLVAKIVSGEVVYLASPVPKWLDDALPDGRIPPR
jgi:predicted ABC-type ATPase